MRTVVFITDGQAWNEPEPAALAARERHGALLFTVGIDTALNDSLLSRLARIGGGTCELVPPHDDIEEAIVRLEARIGSPAATGIVPRALDRARPEPLAIFSGRSVSVLLRGSADSLVLDATDSSGRPIELTMAECRRVTFPLGALWARERVAWLEDRLVMEPDHESELRAEILSVALEHKIASRFTAFVAAEERVSHTGERVTVVQPVELPQAWSESFFELPAMAAPAWVSRIGAPAASSRLWSSRCVLGRSRFTVSPAAGDSGRYADEAESAVLAEAPLAEPHSFAESVGTLRDVVLARGPSGGRHPVDPRRQIETMLATTQNADGSFGGRVDRTAAALAALICLGHSRRKGTRRRVVEKAARWLSQRAKDPLAKLALELLSRTEGGGGLPGRVEVEALLGASVEGKALDRALQL